ncbi:response regulator [Fulvivirgaceae bacterium PWU5]|jgi:CheY-like chemotaxis protein|uniref:Response regulator n=1 Tax=Dawidia cretensis TaxID=2782350 RepID=A0AAP2DY54_9BACT|nr:response regulator [Dawidia cretensis]MBT1709536.1 response regulator [Dawidia cretensis]
MTRKRIPNIWIIDDDPMSSFMLKRLAELGELADIITIFNHARGALDYIEEHKKDYNQLPDVILLDIYMPVVNGWDFLNRYRELRPLLEKEISIILVSSSDHPRDLNQAKTYEEVKAYVTKPVSLERLKELLLVNA